MRRFIGVLLGFLSMAAIAAAAPQRSAAKPATQAPLVAVHVSGSERFKEADIVAATGLAVGSTLGPTEFQEAANRLVASGAFESVEYKFAPAGTGYNVTFKVSDNIDFMPVSYDNFVWFTETELNDAVRKRVPLFMGAVSSGGEMLDQVTAALQEFIAERGLSGQIKFMQSAKLGGSIEGGIFSIEGPTIHVKEVRFPGAGDTELPALQNVAKQLTAASYRNSIASEFAELNLRPIYRERGYLKAQFGSPQVELLDKNPQDPVIELSIPVKPNLQYKVSQVDWKGIKALPGNATLRVVKLRPEMIANALQLDKDVEAVIALYGTKGYLRTSVNPSEVFDDEKSTVAFSMQLTEGDVYHMGQIDVTGLSKQNNAILREAWKLREGEPYDTSYVSEYMKNIRPMLTPNVSVQVERQINDTSHTVDIDMQFKYHADKVIRE